MMCVLYATTFHLLNIVQFLAPTLSYLCLGVKESRG